MTWEAVRGRLACWVGPGCLPVFVLTAPLVVAGCANPVHGPAVPAATPAVTGIVATPVTFAPVPLAMLRSQPVSPDGYQKVVAPADAAVYFTNLRNGSTVASPVRVQVGLKGWGDAPNGGVGAGAVHIHLLVGVNLVDTNATLPADAHHRVFGEGQFETVLDLPPGTHTLLLMLSDPHRMPHHPPVISERIAIDVR